MRRAVASVLAVALVAVTLSGCAKDPVTALSLTGSVTDPVTIVPIPTLATPTPNLGAGFETTSSASTGGQQTATGVSAAANSTTWMLVDTVPVRVGDHLTTGDTIVTLDDATLRAEVTAAQADLARTQADSALLDSRLGDITQNRSEIASKTAELQKTIADLETQRADVAAKLAAAEKAATAAPSVLPTGTPDPAIAVKQLKTALAKIDAGLEQARQGMQALNTAQNDITAAENTLEGARAVYAALVTARDIGVRIAQQQLARATVTAPEPGTVVDVARPGDVLAAGAPLAAIRRDGPTTADTYVTTDQLDSITVGVQASVMADSYPGRIMPAHVSAVSTRYEFVPTTFASKIIHLTRGFKVTVELDGGISLPAGTPVDLSISVK